MEINILIKKREEAIGVLLKEGFERSTLERICISNEDILTINEVLQGENRVFNKVLEVGSYVGISSILLSLMTSAEKIICVDPNFSVDSDLASGKSLGKRSRHYFEILKKSMNDSSIEKIERYDSYYSCYPAQESIKFHIKKNPNLFEIPIFNNESLDCFDLCFIDGDHFSQSVYSDLTKAKTMLSKNGIIILHDMEGNWGKQVLTGINQFLSENEEFYLEKIGNVGKVKALESMQLSVEDATNEDIEALAEKLVKYDKGIFKFFKGKNGRMYVIKDEE